MKKLPIYKPTEREIDCLISEIREDDTYRLSTDEFSDYVWTYLEKEIEKNPSYDQTKRAFFKKLTKEKGTKTAEEMKEYVKDDLEEIINQTLLTDNEDSVSKFLSDVILQTDSIIDTWLGVVNGNDDEKKRIASKETAIDFLHALNIADSKLIKKAELVKSEKDIASFSNQIKIILEKRKITSDSGDIVAALEEAKASSKRTMQNKYVADRILEKISNYLKCDIGAIGRKTGKELVEKVSLNVIDSEFESELGEQIENDFAAEFEKRKLAIKKGAYLVFDKEKIREIFQKKARLERKAVFEELKSMQINPEAFKNTKYSYSLDPKAKIRGKKLDPYAIGEEFLSDFLAKIPEYATNQRHRDLILIANKMINKKELPETDDLVKVLSKNNKKFYSLLSEELKGTEKDEKKQLRHFNLFDTDDVKKLVERGSGLPYELKEMIGEKSGMYFSQRDIIVNELLQILQTAGKNHEQTYNKFRTFWTRFKPVKYDLTYPANKFNLRQKYNMFITDNPAILNEAAKNSGACIYNEPAIEQHIEDSGTLNIILDHDEESEYRPVGYERIFLMKTDKDEIVLGLDNLEVGHKNFDENIDSVRMFGLATMQLCLDSNAKYVLGRGDGRIKYGVRQAFDNKEMNASVKKFGSYDRSYGFALDNDKKCKGTMSVLMQNWRV
jgi:hypothetical protein